MGSWEDQILDHTEKAHSLASLWFFAGRKEIIKQYHLYKAFYNASIFDFARENLISRLYLLRLEGKPQKFHKASHAYLLPMHTTFAKKKKCAFHIFRTHGMRGYYQGCALVTEPKL